MRTAWGRRRVSALAAESFAFTYPLVVMALTRQQLTTTGLSGTLLAPMNTFAHLREFPPAPFSPLVTPNRDILYSSAWLDLSTGPLELSMPDPGRRFYALPMYDAWTQVFAAPGSHTAGSATAKNLLILGPNSPALPLPELARIQAPTSMVWILGRIQTDGPSDYPPVHAFQEGLALRPLAEGGRRSREPTGPPQSATPSVSTPTARLARMNPQEYFGTAARLMATNPAKPEDQPVVSRMAQLGLVAGRPLSGVLAEPQAQQDVARGMRDGMAQIEAAGRKPPTVVRGTWVFPREARQNAQDYLTRAGAAWTGLGAMPPQVGVEATTMVDAQGRRLTGEHRYVLHFDANGTPPVRAFWSLTVREPRLFFIDAPRRDSIGDRDPLRHNTDGSLDVHLQHDDPGDPYTANWLPTPRGNFRLVLRLYAPSPPALGSTWHPPPVTPRR